jgi:hypothetical protein
MEPANLGLNQEQVPINYAHQQISSQRLDSHKNKISSLNGIFIKQRMNLMEVVTGCEMENIFDIFEKKPLEEKEKGKRQWRAKEESTCVQRNCVSQNCRSFNLKIYNVKNAPGEGLEQCLLMERPCTCTCFCLNRPFMTLHYVENNDNIYLGKISDPYDVCKMMFMVYDKADNPIYKIQTCCINCGVICRGCPCGPCEKVSFDVVDLRTGSTIPPISKLNQTCMKDFVTDTDNYGINFIEGTSWEDKSLLLGAVLFLDYMMFEEKGGV